MDPKVELTAKAIRLRVEKERLGIPADREFGTLPAGLQAELRVRVEAQWASDVPMAQETVAKLRFRRDLNNPLPGEIPPEGSD